MTRRIAILADIHANIWALNAVLEHARRQGVDALFNLGDILYGPLKPRETYERLQREPVDLTIRGNQDREIYAAGGPELASNPTLDYVVNDLGQEPIDWLRSLAPSALFEDEILLCHGTPSSDGTYLLEDVSTGHPVPRSEGEITSLLGDARQSLVVCGHTHIPRLVRLANGQTVLNPGSVGLPAYSDASPVAHAMETYSPHASYAIVSRGSAGWDVAFEKVAYDPAEAVRTAASLGRRDWAHALATGRAKVAGSSSAAASRRD